MEQYIENRKPLRLKDPKVAKKLLKLIEPLKVCRKTLRFPNKPLDTYFLESIFFTTIMAKQNAILL